MKRFLILIIPIISMAAMAQQWPPSSVETKAGSRWWWLGSAVDKSELQRSMKEYADHGIRTLEITPIYGVKGNDANNIPFLSPRWMEMLRFVEAQGSELGVQIDMNCGTGWPFGGPTVPLNEATCRVAFRMDTIAVPQNGRISFDITLTEDNVHRVSTTEDDGENTISTARLERVMAYPLDGQGETKDITTDAKEGMVNTTLQPGRWTIFALYDMRTLQQVNRAAPGGEGLVIDHFDRNAVKHYLQRFDDAFSNSGVPYPNTFFNDSYEVYGADWTPKLLEEFEHRRGYKLEYHLPELLLGVGKKANDVLVDYRETLSELLLENFTEQWTEWAHSHGVRTRNQAHGSPANLIDHYATVDIPEIEGFGLSDFGIKGLRRDDGKTRKNYSDLSMLKYASSAAHITGKPLTSCETFTWLTEHFRTSLSQLKPDLDLVFCAGVNRMLFHGTCYSPQNDPWPGWRFYASIDMSPTNSIWRDAPFFNQYVERCQQFLQWGKPDNDFLVYLPVRSMWSKRKGDLLMMFEISNMDKNAPEFIDAVLKIDSLGYDCDYISDRYLLTTQYRDGKLVTEGGTAYNALIIPDDAYMPASVRSHLEQLKQQGAHILFGINEGEMASITQPESVKKLFGLNLIRRKNDDGWHYFIANLTPNDVDEDVRLAVPCARVDYYYPLTGEIVSGDACHDGKVHLSLRSGESIIIRVYDGPPATASQPVHPGIAAEQKAIDLTSHRWQLSFIDSAPEVKKTFRLNRLQTWERLDDDSVGITMGTGVYTTQFTLTKEDAKRKWQIDLGDVRESARVYINDKFVGCAWSVPFILDCGSSLRAGKNTLRIEVTNLPANRIADMDRRNVPWRKFNNINVVDIHYKHTTYEDWDPVPSGLNSTVMLRTIK